MFRAWPTTVPLLEGPARSPAGSRRAQALIQNPQAALCEGLRLDDLVTLSRPVVVRGERIGGGPAHHAWLTKLERLPGTSALSSGTPHHEFDMSPPIFAACGARLLYAPNPTDRTQSPHLAPLLCSKLDPFLRSAPSYSHSVKISIIFTRDFTWILPAAIGASRMHFTVKSMPLASRTTSDMLA